MIVGIDILSIFLTVVWFYDLIDYNLFVIFWSWNVILFFKEWKYIFYFSLNAKVSLFDSNSGFWLTVVCLIIYWRIFWLLDLFYYFSSKICKAFDMFPWVNGFETFSILTVLIDGLFYAEIGFSFIVGIGDAIEIFSWEILTLISDLDFI